MDPKVITALDVIPIVSLDECRKHLRVTPTEDSPASHPDDDLILAYLSAAREWVERYTGLALTPRTLELALDRFPCNEILLPIPPTISVTSVTYVDDLDQDIVIDPGLYMLDDHQSPGWLLPAYGEAWPGAKNVVNSVIVRYVVGYELWNAGSPNPSNKLPRALKQAVLLLLGQFYENREDGGEAALKELPIGVKALCDMYKVRTSLA